MITGEQRIYEEWVVQPTGQKAITVGYGIPEHTYDGGIYVRPTDQVTILFEDDGSYKFGFCALRQSLHETVEEFRQREARYTALVAEAAQIAEAKAPSMGARS